MNFFDKIALNRLIKILTNFIYRMAKLFKTEKRKPLLNFSWITDYFTKK